MTVKVLDGVFLGDGEASFDPDFLEMNKISNLVNLSGRETPNAWASHGLVYLTYMWEDNEFFNILDPKELECVEHSEDPQPFREMTDFINASLRYGISVLLFCQDGGGRAATALAAYLMVHYRWSAKKSLDLILSKKPNAHPNSGYMNQLEELDKYLLMKRGFIKDRSVPQDELNYPKNEGNGAFIYDMVADFPPFEMSRWQEWSSAYLHAAIEDLRQQEGGSQLQAKKARGKEEDEGDEFDHKSSAMRTVENEMVVVLSFVNQRAIRPTTKETLGMNKPRSKGKRLQFTGALKVVLGPNTSENADKPRVFGEIAFDEDEGMALDIVGRKSGSHVSTNHRKSRSALDGGDSMDMTSVDASTSTIRSVLKGSRAANKVNPLNLESVGPAINAYAGPTGGKGERTRGGLSQGKEASARPSGRPSDLSADLAASQARVDAQRSRGSVEGRRGTAGSSGMGGGNSSGLSNDLYGFVGMRAESHTRHVAEPKRKSTRADQVKWASNSPGGQIEADLVRVTAMIAASDEKSGTTSHSRRRKITREQSGLENAANASPLEHKDETKRSAEMDTNPLLKYEHIEGREGDQGAVERAEEEKDFKISLHDLAHRSMFDSRTNMHSHASPSSLSPTARELDRERREEHSLSPDRASRRPGGGLKDTLASGERPTLASLAKADVSAVGLNSTMMGDGPAFGANMTIGSGGQAKREQVSSSGHVSGHPGSHDRTRDLSTGYFGRGEFRDVGLQRAAGSLDELSRGVQRHKVHLHHPPLSTALSGSHLDDPLAAFDVDGGDFAAPGRGNLIGHNHHGEVIPIVYGNDRTRPSSASIANATTGVKTTTGRPGNNKTGVRGFTGTAKNSTYGPGSSSIGTSRTAPTSAARHVPGATRQRPSSASGNAMRRNGRSPGKREAGTGAYASVYLQGTATGTKSSARQTSGGLGGGGSTASNNSAMGARGASSVAASRRKVVSRR